MNIATETATVYRGGGRRWFTKNAACKAEARAKIKEKCECDHIDHEGHGRQDLPCSRHHPDRYPKILRRLTRIYINAAKVITKGSHHE